MSECGIITLLRAHDAQCRLDGAKKVALLIHRGGLVEEVPLENVFPNMARLDHTEKALLQEEILVEAFHCLDTPETERNWAGIRVLAGLMIFKYNMAEIRGPVLLVGPRGLGFHPHEITAVHHLANNIVSRYTWWQVSVRMLGEWCLPKKRNRKAPLRPEERGYN